jgi:hypothetical protein
MAEGPPSPAAVHAALPSPGFRAASVAATLEGEVLRLSAADRAALALTLGDPVHVLPL